MLAVPSESVEPLALVTQCWQLLRPFGFRIRVRVRSEGGGGGGMGRGCKNALLRRLGIAGQ